MVIVNGLIGVKWGVLIPSYYGPLSIFMWPVAVVVKHLKRTLNRRNVQLNNMVILKHLQGCQMSLNTPELSLAICREMLRESP